MGACSLCLKNILHKDRVNTALWANLLQKRKTRRFQNEPACQITLHQQTKNQIKLLRKYSLVKFFLL
jgi:hypothetical protein